MEERILKNEFKFDYLLLICKMAEKGYSRNRFSKEIYLKGNLLGKKLNNGLLLKSNQVY